MTRYRVLIVDDHVMVASGLRAALDDEPDVEVVGLVARLAVLVAAAEEGDPDIVLLDFRLPDGDAGDGIELLREAGLDVPVVVVSGHADTRSVQRAVDAGCAGYLLKDQPIEELAHAVRAVCDGGAVFTPAVLPAVLGLGRRPTGHDLTPREVEVVQLLADGASTADIAARLALSTNTVRNHVQRSIAKLGAHSKLEAVAIALREGIASLRA